MTAVPDAAREHIEIRQMTSRSAFLLIGLMGYLSPFVVHARDGITDIAGIWIVEPKSAPGVLLSTITFTTSGKQGLRGVWRSPGGVANSPVGMARYLISEVKTVGDSLSFKVNYGEYGSGTWNGIVIDESQLKLTSVSEDGRAPETAILKRASRADIAQMKQLERGLVVHKIGLPALRALPSNGLALTPPMGWSSWNHFQETIDDRAVREIADALVSSGLRDVGYVYVNIDDGWQGRRDQAGVLHPNSKFPDMKALADYVHARRLKIGIYISPGPVTCSGYVGTHGHESQDAQTFAQWGIDFLKYDWCSAVDLYKTQQEMQALYQKMGAALQASGRPIVYGLDQYGFFDVGSWGRQVGGNLWRTSFDISDTYVSMADNGFEKHGAAEHAAPGGWNDPDMLEVGNGGMSTEEYRTHLTLWSMLAAPLLLGNDPRVMTPEIKEILLNREVISIDQDPLGKQGYRGLKRGDLEVWTKPLSEGATAIALFNRGQASTTVEVRWSDLGLSHRLQVRDLWKHRDLGSLGDRYQSMLPPHGSALLKAVTTLQ